MSIRFINTTTDLPVDEKIETLFSASICLPFREAAQSAQQRRYVVDVFFVSGEDFDRKHLRIPPTTNSHDRNFINEDHVEEGTKPSQTQSEPNSLKPDEDYAEEGNSIDLLGVYIPQPSDFNHPIIEVSPEKVMAACISFKSKNLGSLPLARLYPTLLIAVVIHELAHLIMDEENNISHDILPWMWLVDRLEEEPQYDFSRRNRRNRFHSRRNLHIKWRKWSHFIEESLANAFVLKQEIEVEEIKFLRAFISDSPPGYNCGALWTGNLKELLETARTWKWLKNNNNHQRWNFIFDEKNNPIEYLVDQLTDNKSMSAVDFKRDFCQYLKDRANNWQKKWEGDRLAWDEQLNGTFGIYWHLITWGDKDTVTQTEHRLFLEQWALNGSQEAVDKHHKLNAEILRSNGKYDDAIHHQRIRLANLSMKWLNNYWYKKCEEEINGSIVELQALLIQ